MITILSHAGQYHDGHSFCDVLEFTNEAFIPRRWATVGTGNNLRQALMGFLTVVENEGYSQQELDQIKKSHTRHMYHYRS